MRVHEKPLIFIHIPKTAGTTLNQILLNEYKNEIFYEFSPPVNPDDFKKLPDEEKLQISILRGHFEFGIHPFYPGKTTYITFLRNPIDRAISSYNFLFVKKEHPFHEEIIKNQHSLKDMLQQGYMKNFDNCQVRFLSGLKELDYGMINEDVYQKALNNFDAFFKSFGIAERFTESVFLMKQQFNWKMPFFIKYNVNKKYVTKKIDDETLELLKHYNRYDIALYEHACNKFSQMIAERGWRFQMQLIVFKLLNMIYSPFRLVYVKIAKPDIK